MNASFLKEKVAGIHLFLLCQGHSVSSALQMLVTAYCLHARPGEPSIIFYGGRLFQEYVVDAWALCEQSALNWARFHQKELCADLYQNL